MLHKVRVQGHSGVKHVETALWRQQHAVLDILHQVELLVLLTSEWRLETDLRSVELCCAGAMFHMAGGPPAPVQVIPGGLPPPGHPLPVSAQHLNPAFASAPSSSGLPPPAGAVSRHVTACVHNWLAKQHIDLHSTSNADTSNINKQERVWSEVKRAVCCDGTQQNLSCTKARVDNALLYCIENEGMFIFNGCLN